MQGCARLDELKEKERRFRLAFGAPLTYREQALFFCLSTLYPQQKTDRNHEFLVKQSAFSTVEVEYDRYPLGYQRAKAPPPADARPPPPAKSAPSEAVDVAEELISSVRLQARAETDDAGCQTL